MSIPAMRERIGRIIGPRNPENPGLALYRYHRAVDQSGKYEHRDACINALAENEGLGTLMALYRKAFDRWEAVLEADSIRHRKIRLATRDRLFIGLGSASVLEFGISLHPVYGLPMIPGSAVKGVCAAYTHDFLGASDPKWKIGGEIHRAIFGGHDPEKEPEAGALDFLDALWVPGSGGPFVREIINPHHSGYYSGEGKKPPADWEAPIPVKMLGVEGTFLFAIRGPHGWNDTGLSLLKKALKMMGIGGKTRAGYGRFIDPSACGKGRGSGRAGGGEIPSGKRVWKDATVQFTAGNGTLTATEKGGGGRAVIIGKEKCMACVPEKFHKKLFKNRKAVKAAVEVSVEGNKIEIVRVMEAE